jgi:cytochrome c biogenesis protein CcmG, thiol:disulfide interchange protein DsbE
MNSRFPLLALLLLAFAVTAKANLTNSNPPAVALINSASSTNSTTAPDGDPVAPELFATSIRGQHAPKFEIEKWLTAEPSMQGKFVLIDFWATWCVGCRQSISELNGFQKKFKDRLVIIGITDETAEEVRKTTLPHMEYSVASDPDERMMRALDIQALPHSILIDPSGIVRYEGNPLFLDDKKLQHLLDKYSQ